MFILTSSQSLKRVWVLLLKDSIPCPIPVFLEAKRSTASLLVVKIQNVPALAIDKRPERRFRKLLHFTLLPKKHTAAKAAPHRFTIS
ncbi:hypothetical protein [Agrobacterium tumefaciens]|uniref:hypothetical protein n=1 Tax=Agrobacterium tumefaciens TaxID=358 RepID=UPI00287E6B8E|nr:hypothetical protein [Agrobacterium tumefaciens]MDS7596600.1 hypothetical protein [Agrobacterium tumefaciens]